MYSDEDDDEEEQEEGWGKKKAYWSGDTADLEIGQDVQDAEDEEEAAEVSNILRDFMTEHLHLESMIFDENDCLFHNIPGRSLMPCTTAEYINYMFSF